MTAAEIKIEDLFEKDIRRDVNGVIKVDQEDEISVYTELDEYVVTGESLKHFDTFFRNYAATMEEPTDRIGVWISGFLARGSHISLKSCHIYWQIEWFRGRQHSSFSGTK